jgi:hypothetical protein
LVTACEKNGDYRLPKCILDYKPTERRDAGRPRRRWQYSAAEIGLKICALKLTNDDDNDDYYD